MKKRFCLILPALLLGLILCGCADSELYTLREQGVKAYDAGDYTQARSCFEEALSHGNGEVSEVEFDILRYRAECELRLGEYEAAEETYRILGELDPSEEGKLLYGNLKEQYERIRILREAKKNMDEGAYDKAYASLNELAGLGGDEISAAAWFNRAVCAEYMGNWETAAELFGDYLVIYPEDAEAKKEYEFCITR